MITKKARDLKPGDKIHGYGTIITIQKQRFIRQIFVRFIGNRITESLLLSKNEEVLVEDEDDNKES